MSEQPKPKRSFRVIIRFFQIVAALIFVFWASFFITLAIRSSHPIEYLFSYVEDFFGDDKDKKTVTPTERNLDNRERAPAVDDKKINKDRSSIIPVNNPDVGIFGRVERIFSIEE
ncbi:MAG: hypothetical protein IJS81_04520, partial [Selenomonadaceae bacterium]|nr:hypothetical protein [Selenomonadaceae bacterium]